MKNVAVSNNTHLLSKFFMRQKSRHIVVQLVLCLVSHREEINVPASLCSFLEGLGKSSPKVI